MKRLVVARNLEPVEERSKDGILWIFRAVKPFFIILWMTVMWHYMHLSKPIESYYIHIHTHTHNVTSGVQPFKN